MPPHPNESLKTCSASFERGRGAEPVTGPSLPPRQRRDLQGPGETLSGSLPVKTIASEGVSHQDERPRGMTRAQTPSPVCVTNEGVEVLSRDAIPGHNHLPAECPRTAGTLRQYGEAVKPRRRPPLA